MPQTGQSAVLKVKKFEKIRAGRHMGFCQPARQQCELLCRNFYLFELPFLAVGFLAAPVMVPPAFELAIGLAACFLRFLAAGFFSPVFDVVAAAVVFAAGFFAGAFLFCAANAVVPASAKAKTILITIRFIRFLCPP